MIYVTNFIHCTAMGLGGAWSIMALIDHRFEIAPFFALIAVSGGMSLVKSLSEMPK